MPSDEHELAPVVGERVVEREICAPHARQAIEPLLEIAIERGQFLRGVGGGWSIQRDQDASSSFETEVLPFEIAEAAGEHRRAGDEDDR